MKREFDRNLALLLGGQFISQLGDKFYALALSWWVLQTTGSPAKMGLTLFASMAPSVVLGFFTGGFIDRFDRKGILVCTDIVRGLAIMAVLAVYLTGHLNLAMIITVQVLLSAASAFFNPAVLAAMPQIVEKEKLVKANGTSQLLSGIANIAGPVLGGMAVSKLGYGFIFVFNGLSFFASALCEWLLRLPPRGESNGIKTTMAETLRQGYAYILTHKRLMALLAVVAMVHFFVGSVQVVMPVLANSLAGDGARNLGYIESAFGFGIVAAALLIRARKPKGSREVWMFGGLVALGVMQLASGLLAGLGVQPVFPYLAVFFLLSASVIVISTNYTVILQQTIDNNMAGRVFGIVGSVGNLTLPVAVLVFGYVLTGESLGIVTIACGAGVLAVCGLVAVAYKNPPCRLRATSPLEFLPSAKTRAGKEGTGQKQG